MKLLLITTILVFLLTGCVEKITVTGQYGEYSFKPRKPLTVGDEK